MAPDPSQDWISAAAERVFSDPSVRRGLEEFERKLADGTLRTVPHEEVVRRMASKYPGFAGSSEAGLD